MTTRAMTKSVTKRRCLLVEDRSDDAVVLRKHFERYPDYELEWVKDGDEAVQYLEKRPPFATSTAPDVILLDLKLPRMDGFSFLEWRRSRDVHRQIPVMVLSCLNFPEDMRRAYELGAKSYLNKPINWNRFGPELSRVASASGGWPTQVHETVAQPRITRVTCILTFKDGRKVAVTAAALSEKEIVRFEYGGDTARLRPFAESGTIGFLRWYMEGMAANHDAYFAVKEGEDSPR